MKTPLTATLAGRKLMLTSAIAAMGLLSACAGRPPALIETVQAKDQTTDCTAIQAELSANNQRIVDLSGESGRKVGQNVAAGVAGLLIWPLWFAMDFQDAAGHDTEALKQRDLYLTALSGQRCNVGYQRSAGVTASATTTVQPSIVPASTSASAPAARNPLYIRAAAVTPEMARDVHLDPPRGVMILSVGMAGAAMEAGMLERDVILDFNGSPVNGEGDMQRTLAAIAPNSTVIATIWRDGTEKSVHVHF